MTAAQMTFEQRALSHAAAVRRRVMHPANAIVEVKPRIIVRPTTRVPAEAFLLARCKELGTTFEAVADRRGPQPMVTIRVALVLEVHQKYPALTKEVLGRIFNRQPRRIADILEMYAGQD